MLKEWEWKYIRNRRTSREVYYMKSLDDGFADVFKNRVVVWKRKDNSKWAVSPDKVVDNAMKGYFFER